MENILNTLKKMDDSNTLDGEMFYELPRPLDVPDK